MGWAFMNNLRRSHHADSHSGYQLASIFLKQTGHVSTRIDFSPTQAFTLHRAILANFGTKT